MIRSPTGTLYRTPTTPGRRNRAVVGSGYFLSPDMAIIDELDGGDMISQCLGGLGWNFVTFYLKSGLQLVLTSHFNYRLIDISLRRRRRGGPSIIKFRNDRSIGYTPHGTSTITTPLTPSQFAALYLLIYAVA